MKKILSAVLVVVVLLCALGNTSAVYAASSKPGVKSVSYSGKGKVRVTFKRDVSYKDAKVTVTGPGGDKLTAKITSKEKREIKFTVNKLQKNGKYEFKISGVKDRSARKYSTVSGSFKADDYKDRASSSILKIKKTEADERSREIKLYFTDRVSYKNVNVKVTDSSGKKLSAKVTDEGSDSLTFKIGKTKRGEVYSFKVTGIKKRGDDEYVVISGKLLPDEEAVSVKRASYDLRDRELNVSFSVPVRYKNEKVTVKDSGGKKYSASIVRSDRDGMRIRVRDLKKGKKYTVSISGVAPRDGSNYETVSKSFKAD